MSQTNKKFERLIFDSKTDIKHDKEWFVNLTTESVPNDVEKMIAFGPKFSVKHKSHELPIFNIITDIENLAQNIDDPRKKSEFRGKASTIASNHIKMMNSLLTNEDLTLHEYYNNTKKFFKDHPNVLTVEADKGNTTILM